MYLCGIQVNMWWRNGDYFLYYCQAGIGYHDLNVCGGHINPYSHNEESAATHTPTNVNGKLQILVANTMGSGNNIAQPHDGGTMMVWRSIAHHLSIHGWHYSNLHELACSRHCLL